MADEYAVMGYPDPDTYGPRKFLVELFLTERLVITVYANDEEQAKRRALVAPYRSEQGLMGVHCKNGVSHAHFDEDYGYKVTAGDVEEDDDDSGGSS